MKIFITGGRGFIGRQLVESLANQRHDITLLTRSLSLSGSSAKAFDDTVHYLIGDLTDPAFSLSEGLRDCDVVFHCAGETSDLSRMEKLHIVGTQKLLTAVKQEAQRSAKQIHFVQLSSVGAYGPPAKAMEPRTILETSLENPLGLYEITKTRADKLVRAAAEPGVLSYCILRPSNVFGEGMSNSALKGIVAMIRRRLFFFIGRPGAISTHIHVQDVADALIECGFNLQARGQIFNLSNDCLLEELIQGICAGGGYSFPTVRFPVWFVSTVVFVCGWIPQFPLTRFRMSTLIYRTRYPTTKITEILGYTPTRPVPQTISQFSSWY